MTANYLLGRARTELPGASDAGINQMLYEVYHEFFDATNAWMEDITLDIVANTRDYPLTAQSIGLIIRLAGVADGNGIAQVAMLRDLEGPTLTLRDNPTQAGQLTVTVILNVLPVTGVNTPAIPDYVEATWGPIIFEGLVGHMMTQPTKPYSNESLGIYHLKRFRDGLARVKTAVLRRNTFGTNCWAFPQLFRTRGQRGGVSVGGNVARF